MKVGATDTTAQSNGVVEVEAIDATATDHWQTRLGIVATSHMPIDCLN